MSTGKKISELPEESNLQQNDLLVVATSDHHNKKTTTQDLYRSMHHPKTLTEAKAGRYVQGEIVTIVDYSVSHLAQAQFIAIIYDQKPGWFAVDVPDAVYEVNGSQGKILLINTALTETQGLILTLNNAKKVQPLLNNTGKLFYEPNKKAIYTYLDNALRQVPIAAQTTLQASVRNQAAQYLYLGELQNFFSIDDNTAAIEIYGRSDYDLTEQTQGHWTFIIRNSGSYSDRLFIDFHELKTVNDGDDIKWDSATAYYQPNGTVRLWLKANKATVYNMVLAVVQSATTIFIPGGTFSGDFSAPKGFTPHSGASVWVKAR